MMQWDHSFTAGGTALPFLREGWGEPEPGRVWCVGESSRMVLPGPGDRPGSYMLLLHVEPFGRPQRLRPTVDGVPGREQVVAHETTIAIAVELPPGGRSPWIVVRLDHPDGLRPVDLSPSPDVRVLSVAVTRARLVRMPDAVAGGWVLPPTGPEAVEAVSGLAPRELMFEFESLGQNCELGLVQRRCAAEPVGLLRFAYMPPHSLIHGLQVDFVDLGQADHLTSYPSATPEPEYIVRETRYEMEYHTFWTVESGKQVAVGDEVKRLGLYRRKLLEDVQEGQKTFVYWRLGGLSLEDVAPIHAELSRSRANWLLWVTEDEQRPAGTVELLAPGLLRGSIDRLAPLHDGHNLNFEAWLSLCANARRLRLAWEQRA